MDKIIFHIGELSDLFNISVDSIRYYEKMGLLSPARNANNGYREYSLSDFETIVIIRELLGLGFHMEQIINFVTERTIDSTLNILNQEISVIDNTIMKLAMKKRNIECRIRMINTALNLPRDGKVYEQYINERHVVMISNKNLPDSQVGYSAVRFMKETHKEINIIGYCDCYTLDLERSNPMSDYYRTKNVFFLSDEITSYSNYTLNKGNYLTLSYQGNLKKTKQYMPKLYAYAKAHNLKVIGDPIEICHIDDYETLDESEFVIELQLPIK